MCTMFTGNATVYVKSMFVNIGQKKKKYIRTAAGNKWEDPTLLDWDPNDYR